MKRTLLIFMVLLLTVTFVISGCAKPSPDSTPDTAGDQTPDPSGEEPDDTEEKPAGELPEITFYHGYFQDDWQPAVEMRKIYDEFAEANKDKFIFTPVALDTGNEGVYDKCIQEISRGKFPDIVDVSGMNIIPAASEADLIVDLKPYIDADPAFKEGVGVNYVQNEKDGKIFTVRDQLETIGFWYNEELFEKAGATTPDQWKTWADFDEAVDKLAASPEVETPFTMNQGWPTSIVLAGHLLGSEEGRQFSTGVPTTFDNSAFRDTLTFLKDNVLGKISNEHFTAADSDKYREDFFDGKAAILFNGVWESGSFADVSIDATKIKGAIFPTNVEGETAAIVSASPGFVISKDQDQEKIDACIEFVKYMTSVEIAEEIFTKVMAMPPSTAIDYDKYINDEGKDVTLKALALACKAASEATYQSPTASTYWDQDLSDAIEGKYAAMKDGSKTIDQIVDELDSLIEE